MFKVIASRGAGKTTSLMHYANDLAHKYPDKMVLFVTQHPQLMVKKFLELTNVLLLLMNQIAGSINLTLQDTQILWETITE